MRSPLLLALLLSTSPLACDKQGAPPPGPATGVHNPGEVATPGPVESGAGGPSSVTCGEKTCAADEQCISYYGIAGPSGPMFHECGIPCKRGEPNEGCPADKRCHTIADGPGPVCR